MLNYIWLGLVVLAVVIGGLTGHLEEAVKNAFDLSKTAVMEIALPLTAVMGIWLGIMRLADKSGLIFLIARAVRPLLKKLFPEVPADHPAMGSMVMNIAANMLGLGNAATPLGLRAMMELQKLNPNSGWPSNAMCTFLVINTASIQLIPATAIGILAVAGGKNPTAIVGTAFLASVLALTAALMAAKVLEKLPLFRVGPPLAAEPGQAAPEPELPKTTCPPGRLGAWKRAALAALGGFFLYLFAAMIWPGFHLAVMPQWASTGGFFTRSVQAVSVLAIPFFVSFFSLYAALRGVKVYEEFVEGAKEGFAVAVRIIPYLVTILAAVGLFRGAHGIELIARALKPVLDWLGFPPELLSLAVMRPLSGSGSIALLADVVKTYGPNHLYSMMAGTILGSTETTFYVLAVYFGAVGIRRSRHAVVAGLLADIVGIIASVVICRMVFGQSA